MAFFSPVDGKDYIGERSKGKRWAPKVRTGCATCRSRRVKCDERKPECRRCTAAGKRCSGLGYYCKRPQWLIGASSSSPWPSSSAPVLLPRLLYRPAITVSPPGITPGELELSTFDFMRRETVLKLTGRFNQGLWVTGMMRATQASPVIWHASLALAAMHRRSTLIPTAAKGARQKQYDFAIKHYNISIQHILAITSQSDHHPSPADQVVLLLANLLFLGVSRLIGDTYQAVVHAKSSLKLLYEWKFWEHRGNHVVNVNAITSAINKIEGSFTLRMEYFLRSIRNDRFLETEAVSPPGASQLQHLYFELQSIMGQVLVYGRVFNAPTGSLQNLDPIRHLSRQLNDWKARLNAMAMSPKDPAQSQDLLALSYLASGFILVIHMLLPQAVPGDFETGCSGVIDLAEKLYHSLLAEQHPQKRSAPEFSFSDMAICETLYYIVSKCRDRGIRQRAVKLMELWPQTDTVWDSRFLARICKTLIALEEQPGKQLQSHENWTRPADCDCVSGDFICKLHMIYLTEVHFKPGGLADIVYKTVAQCTAEEPGTVVEMVC